MSDHPAASQFLQHMLRPSRSRLAALRRLCAHGNRQMLTIDLFDTLLLRGMKPETARFRDLAQRIAALDPLRERDIRAAAVLETRLQCAKLAYQAATPIHSVREARIADLLRMQLTSLGLDQTLQKTFLDEELALEAASLTPNRPLVELCREFRRRGLRIAVISDMYLDAPSLRQLLSHHGLADLAESVHVSADYGVSKASGQLFREVAAREQVSFSAMVHAGDNFRSDYAQPRGLGIAAVWLPRSFSWRLVNGLWNRALRVRHVNLRGI